MVDPGVNWGFGIEMDDLKVCTYKTAHGVVVYACMRYIAKYVT
jgi:hypothetical protein